MVRLSDSYLIIRGSVRGWFGGIFIYYKMIFWGFVGFYDDYVSRRFSLCVCEVFLRFRLRMRKGRGMFCYFLKVLYVRCYRVKDRFLC